MSIDCSYTWTKKSTILQKPLHHVKGFQLLTIVTKSSILDVSSVLDPPLKICLIFQKGRVKTVIHAYNFIHILNFVFGDSNKNNAIISYPVVIDLVFSIIPQIVFLILVRTMFTQKGSQEIYATESLKDVSKAFMIKRYTRKRKMTLIHLH